jgi:PAS domain S-box-containing protein
MVITPAGADGGAAHMGLPSDRRLHPLDPRLRPGRLLVLGAAAYGAAIWLSDLWKVDGWTPLWLPLGVGYAFVAVCGRRFAAVIALVAAAGSAAQGRSAWQTVAFALVAAASALAIYEISRRIGETHGERPRDTIARTTASVVGSAIGAFFFVLLTHQPSRYAHALLGQFAGVLVTAPCLRSWLRGRVTGTAKHVEMTAMLLTTAAVAELVSSGALGADLPLSYLMFPPVVWAALRLGRRGVGTASFLVAVISSFNLSHLRGPFIAVDNPSLALDTFLIVVALTGLLLVGIDHARRRSEERFRALIENATDLVTVLGPDAAILYYSPSSERILGYRPDELIGRNVLDFIHEDDLPVARDRLGRAAAGEETSGLVRFRHRDGRWVELEGDVRDLSDSAAIGGMLVNARDVTRRRAAERELAAAEQRYRELVERLPLAIYLRPLEPTGPSYMSPQIEELLGYPVERWLREPELVLELVHPDDRGRLLRWARADGSMAHVEIRVRAADGRYVWVLDQRSPIHDDSGALIGYQGYVLDITERKRLEEQLQQAQRLESLGLLAGGVAHDFNNLLTAISGYTELVQSRVADPQARRDLDEVLAAARRAGELTHQLLAFGRRQTLVTAVTSLNEVVARTERLLARLIEERIEIVCRLDPDLHPVRADAGQIEQVLLNLALNARDAMSDGGTLTIETANVAVVEESGAIPPGDYAVVSVSDTGHGFDADVRERLFEPFFTTKEVGKGTGLGLAVVFGIVEQSRGHVVVESEPGAGSCFRVLLPRTYERAAAATPPTEVALLPGSETILLVEDEPTVRALTATLLEANGYRVVSAATPEEALAVAEPYDLLLTDVVMPGMTGPELWHRLSERGRRPAVLFTSGYSAAAVADGASLPGELLEKPFTGEELVRRVRGAIEAAAPAAASAAVA